MGEELRSSDVLCAKSDGIEASVSELVGEKDRGHELSGEIGVKVIDEDALVSTPKGQVEKSDSGDDKGGGSYDYSMKRSRIDWEAESGNEGGEEKMNNKEGEPEVVVRVLRSRSVMKTQGKKEGEMGERESIVAAKRSRGNDGFEDKRVDVINKFSNGFDGEDRDGSNSELRQRLKRKRGRPPKRLEENSGPVKGSVDVKKEETNQTAWERTDFPDNEVKQKLKRKRGRPPKYLQETDNAVKKSFDVEKEHDNQSYVEETDLPDNEGNKEKVTSECGRSFNAEGCDGSGKERTAAKKESSGHLNGEGGYRSDCGVKENIKRKRGRPFKVQQSVVSGKKKVQVKIDESDGSVSLETDEAMSKKLRPKRGRPPKALVKDGYGNRKLEVIKEDINQSAGEMIYQPDKEVKEEVSRKRGRPHKVQVGAEPVKERVEVAAEDNPQSAAEDSYGYSKKVGKKLKPKRGRPSMATRALKLGRQSKINAGIKSRYSENHDMGNANDLSGKKFIGKESKANKVTLARNNKRSKDDTEVRESKWKAGELSRSRQKQAVREKIVDLLLAAGWTIQYRPRNGREYNDAVYVNPKGRTHWSVTLAYRVLKSHYEDVSGESNAFNTGFKFVPIPEEELHILTKVISKPRSDTNKKKKWKLTENGRKIAEGVTKKKKKKQKTKKQEDTAGLTDKEMASIVKDGKRLKTNGRKRFAMKIRYSKEGVDSDSGGYMLYSGKRSVLGWMVDMGTLPLDGKVQCSKRRKTRTMLRGSITKDGILCDCCSKTLTTLEFEAHAGSKSCHPLKNIYLESGPSLLQCQLDTWRKQDESDCAGFHLVDTNGDDPNDDTCGICGDGGDLICCDGCPSTFHQSCLEIKKCPSGVWHCIYCSCKFCGMVGGSPGQGDADNAATTSAILTCCLCEEKYHKSCVQEKDAINDLSGKSFCGKNCEELYDRVQMLLGVKHDLEEGYSWTLVHRFDVVSDISLAGMPRKVECNSKVAVASLIMDECFLPMVDHRSGVNLIRNIVYNFGSNFYRLNYSGFLTAILERGDEIVSAASIRIHGNNLAEMPFIGTRYMYRRQGMCRRLLTAIENVLRSLKVEKLVIPAISELRETWTSVFGFKPVEGLSMQKMRNMNMMVFPGVDMLYKPLLEHQTAEENAISEKGLSRSIKPKERLTMDKTETKSDDQRSASFDLNFPSDCSMPHDGVINGQPVGTEPGLLLAGGCMIATSDLPSENDNLTVCLEQSTVICDKLDGASKSAVSPLDISCDAHEQAGEITERQNGIVSASIVSPGDETMPVDDPSNQHDVSGEESKSPVASHIGYNATDCGEEFLGIPKDGMDSVQCDVPMEGSYNNPNSLADDVTSTTQSQDLFFQHDLNVSVKDAVYSDSDTANVTHDVVQSTCPMFHPRTEDPKNGYCAALPVDDHISLSCEDSVSGARKVEGNHATDQPSCDPSHMAAPDVAVKRRLQTSAGNDISLELTMSSCGVDLNGVPDPKQLHTTAKSHPFC